MLFMFLSYANKQGRARRRLQLLRQRQNAAKRHASRAEQQALQQRYARERSREGGADRACWGGAKPAGKQVMLLLSHDIYAATARTLLRNCKRQPDWKLHIEVQHIHMDPHWVSAFLPTQSSHPWISLFCSQLKNSSAFVLVSNFTLDILTA